MITEDTLAALQARIDRRTERFHKASRYLAELNAFPSSRSGSLLDRLTANFEAARDTLTQAKQELFTLLSSEGVRGLVRDETGTAGSNPTIIQANEELMKFLARNPRYLSVLDSHAFEELIARIFLDLGHDVELMRATHDGGKDLILRSDSPLGRFICYVQCKRYAPVRPVGIEAVREVYGIHVADKVNQSMIVTTSYFTQEAIDFSRGLAFLISLKNYNDIVSWLQPYAR